MQKISAPFVCGKNEGRADFSVFGKVFLRLPRHFCSDLRTAVV